MATQSIDSLLRELSSGGKSACYCLYSRRPSVTGEDGRRRRQLYRLKISTMSRWLVVEFGIDLYQGVDNCGVNLGDAVEATPGSEVDDAGQSSTTGRHSVNGVNRFGHRSHRGLY